MTSLMASYKGQQCNINSQILLLGAQTEHLGCLNVMDSKLGETVPLKDEKGMSVEKVSSVEQDSAASTKPLSST